MKIVAALDIGTTKITTVIASVEQVTYRILGYHTTHSSSIKKGYIVDIEQVVQRVKESIQVATKMANVQVNTLFVAVGGPHIASQKSHGITAVSNPHKITEYDLDKVTAAAEAISLDSNREILHISPRQYTIDGQGEIVKPIGMSGVRLEVDCTITTGSKTNLKNIDQVLAAIDMRTQRYIYSGIASAHTTLTDTEKELGVALFDIGGGKGDISVYIEGALVYCGSIPVGAKYITNDIAMGTYLDFHHAEKLKKYLSTKADYAPVVHKVKPLDIPDIAYFDGIPEDFDFTAKDIFEGIMRPRLEEIMTLAKEKLHEAGTLGSIPGGIVLTGGGALTIGALEICKKIINVPVRLGVPKRDQFTGLIEELLHPAYATALGLCIESSRYAVHNVTDHGLFSRGSFSSFDSSILGKIRSQLRSLFQQLIP